MKKAVQQGNSLENKGMPKKQEWLYLHPMIIEIKYQLPVKATSFTTAFLLSDSFKK